MLRDKSNYKVVEKSGLYYKHSQQLLLKTDFKRGFQYNDSNIIIKVFQLRVRSFRFTEIWMLMKLTNFYIKSILLIQKKIRLKIELKFISFELTFMGII